MTKKFHDGVLMPSRKRRSQLKYMLSDSGARGTSIGEEHHRGLLPITLAIHDRIKGIFRFYGHLAAGAWQEDLLTR